MAAEAAETHPELYDAVLIYSDHPDDAQLAVKVQKYIHTFVPALADGKPVRICVFESKDLIHIQDKIAKLREVIQRSSYMFILVTENLENDSWGQMQTELCLNESLDKPEKRHCAVPFCRNLGIDRPSGLKSPKGYYVPDMFHDRQLEIENITVDDIESQVPNKQFLKSLRTLFKLRSKKR